MNDNCLERHLPRNLRSRFRALALASLLWDDPSTWRLRRIDTFADLDLSTYRNRFQIDFRIRRERVLRTLELLDASLAKEGAPAEAEVRRCLASLVESGGDLSEPDDWAAAQMFLPVAWMWGPPTELNLTLDGAEVVALNRKDTASLVAKVAVRLVEELRGDEGSDAMPRVLQDSEFVRDLYWHMTVSDWWSLADDPLLRYVGLDWIYLGKNVCKRWIERRLAAVAGDSPRALRRIVNDEDARIAELLEASVSILQSLQGNDKVPPKALRHPFWNPLMLLPTYLAKLEPSPGGLNPADVLSDYLGFCEKVVCVLRWVARTESPLSDFVWESLRDLAWCWPVICRAPVDVDSSHTIHGEWTVACRKRPSRGWHYYDIAVADADSYHVDILADHAELELRPDSAKVDVGYRVWRFWPFRRFEPSSGRWERLLSRPSPFDAREYFSRCTDSSPRVQSFYSSSTHVAERWQGLIAALDSDGRLGPVQLRIKKRILDYVVVTNWLFAIIFFVLSVIAWLAGVARLAGLGLLSPSATMDAARLLLPMLVAVLALFTLERHNNPIVASYLRRPWLLLALSLAVIVTSLLVHLVAGVLGWPYWGTYTVSPSDYPALWYAIWWHAGQLLSL